MSRHICIYYFIPSSQLSGKIGIILIQILQFLKTLKSLLQHHSSKASILWRSAFFTIQVSHPYMTTRKTTALTRQTFVGKVISLLLVRYYIYFIPCILVQNQSSDQVYRKSLTQPNSTCEINYRLRNHISSAIPFLLQARPVFLKHFWE